MFDVTNNSGLTLLPPSIIMPGPDWCYVNLPLPLAAAIDIEPGEMVEWKVDNRYKLWLIRQHPKLKKRKKS